MLTLLCALALATDPLETISKSQEKLFEKLAAGVVYVSNVQGFGSGFFINDSGLILTNAHVVGNAKTVTVVLHDGRRFQGEVVERGDDKIDVALIKIPLENAPVLPTEGATPRVGQWVGAIGHGAGAVWTFSTGMVSNVYSEGSEQPVFQTQIPLNPGNSGGPIFNHKGEVLGVVTAGLKEATAINFGVSIETARRALRKMSETCQCLRITAPAGHPIFVDQKMVGSGPVVVVASMKDGPHEVFMIRSGKMLKQTINFPQQREVTLEQPPQADGG